MKNKINLQVETTASNTNISNELLSSSSQGGLRSTTSTSSSKIPSTKNSQSKSIMDKKRVYHISSNTSTDSRRHLNRNQTTNPQEHNNSNDHISEEEEEEEGSSSTLLRQSNLPTEFELVLMCLDYLRNLRHGNTEPDYPDYLREKEYLDPNWLSISVYALEKSILHSNISSNSTQIPNFDTTKSVTLPSLQSQNAQIKQTIQYDDNHKSNTHRFYHLNGLASGVSLGGPISLTEAVMTGLATLNGRSRYNAEKEMVNSPLFEQFIQAVQSKGFFENENDSEEYEDKFRKVVAKFRQKLAIKAENAVEGYWMGSDPTLNDWTRFRTTEKNEEQSVMTSEDMMNHISSKIKNTSSATATHSNAIPTPSSHEVDLEEAEKFKNTGNVHMQNRDFAQAVDAYTTALRICPSGSTSHVYFCNRAAAYLSLKQYADAILDSERSLALKPDYGKAHARLGLAYYVQGMYEKAVESYEKALQYEPENKTSKSYLEKAQYRLSSHKKKPLTNNRQHYLRTPSPNHVLQEEQEQQASESVSQSTDIKSRIQQEKEADKLKNEGNTFMSLKQYAQAVECYTQALRLSPAGINSHVYYSNRAAALCYLEKYQEAEQDSEKSLVLKPDYGKAHARLGLSRFFLGDYEGSVEAYENALLYDPGNKASESYLNKARARVEEKNAVKSTSNTFNPANTTVRRGSMRRSNSFRRGSGSHSSTNAET